MKKYLLLVCLIYFISIQQVCSEVKIYYKHEMNTKIKVIWTPTNNGIPAEVENFCAGKDIIDIKMVCSAGSITIIIIYKER